MRTSSVTQASLGFTGARTKNGQFEAGCARPVEVQQDSMIDMGCARDATMAAANRLFRALRTNVDLPGAVREVIAASLQLDKAYEQLKDDANARLGRTA